MNFTKEKINSINDVEVYAVTFINDNDFSITFYNYGGIYNNFNLLVVHYIIYFNRTYS